MSFHIVDAMCDTVPPLSRGVVLDIFENERRMSTLSISRRLSTGHNELFTGSLVNVDLYTRKKGLPNPFGLVLINLLIS